MSESIYHKAIQAWGVNSQMRMAQEECAELIVAISHYLRTWAHEDSEHITEEIADVEIMMSQLRTVAGDAAVDAAKEKKLRRLEERIKAREVRK